MANPVSSRKTQSTQTSFIPETDYKSVVFPLIRVADIQGHIREYERRCGLKPNLKGSETEVLLLKKLISSYPDPVECLCEKDADMFLLICQCNADHRPPRNQEKWNDWLFRQMVIDYNLESRIVVKSTYFDFDAFLFG